MLISRYTRAAMMAVLATFAISSCSGSGGGSSSGPTTGSSGSGSNGSGSNGNGSTNTSYLFNATALQGQTFNLATSNGSLATASASGGAVSVNSGSDTASVANKQGSTALSDTAGIAPTGGVNFTSTPTASTDISAPSGATVQTASLSNGSTAAITQYGASQNLSYTQYGVWTVKDSGGNLTSVGAFGTGVNLASAPTTGTAQYNGSASGVVTTGTTTKATSTFTGTTSLTANFGTGAITGAVISPSTSTPNGIGGYQGGAMNSITMAGTISGTGFSGTATAASDVTSGSANISGATGTFGGGFYGTGAAEVAGTFKLTGGSNNAQVIGAFGAHK